MTQHEFGSAGWFVMVMQTIDAVVREMYPKTRPNGPDPELIGNLLYHARERGATVDDFRKVLRDSPEFTDNQTTSDPDPSPIDEPDPVTNPGDGRDPLILPLVATPRGWGHGGGYRPIFGASWFPSLRILRDDPSRFDRTLDWLVDRGVNCIRSFGFVCHPSYWRGREVLSVDAQGVGQAWPDFDDLAIAQARAFERRGVSWFLTAGDTQLARDEFEIYRRIRRALDSAGLSHVVGPVDVNEAWQNTTARDDAPSHFARMVAPFHDRPWATSAHSGEDNAEHLNKMWRSVGAPVCTVHGPGGTDLMVRHIINHRHENEGVGFRVALMQGEPRGPGQDVSAGAVNHPSWIVLSAAAAWLTGQLYVLHCSRGVRDRDNDDPWDAFAPYFERCAAVAKWIPRSRVMDSQHGGRGGSGNAVFVSTRADGAFYGDRADIRGEFHRCDSVLFESGERGCLLFGGTGDRAAKAYRSVEGTFINTHGQIVSSGRIDANQVVRFTAEEAGDGLLFVGR